MQNSLGGQKSPDQFPCAGFYQNSRQMIAHILRKSHLNNPTVPFGTGALIVTSWHPLRKRACPRFSSRKTRPGSGLLSMTTPGDWGISAAGDNTVPLGQATATTTAMIFMGLIGKQSETVGRP